MELVNSVVGNVASYAVNNLAVLTTDGDGPWDGNYDGEWWWWVLRPLTFILTVLFIAFIVRFVVFGGFRRFNGPGGPRGGGNGDDYGRDRTRDAGSDTYRSQAAANVEAPVAQTPMAPTPPVEPPRADSPGLQRARDILAERYARGEIDGEEYRGRLDQLG